MAARHADIADAVVTYLNGLSLSQAFTAARSTLATFKLESVQSLTVKVLFGPRARQRVNRAQMFDRTYTIEIMVQDKLDVTATTDLDAAVLLCEEIADALPGQAMSAAHLSLIESDQVADEAMIEQQHQFACIISATYRELN